MTQRPPITAAHSGLRSELVRSSNLSTVLRALHARGPLSRSQLGTLTGLTRSAVGALVTELVRLDLVVEEGSAVGGGRGRPSAMASPAADRNVVIAVQINVDSIVAAAVGLGGTIHSSQRMNRPRRRIGVEPTVADVAALCQQLITGLAMACTVHGVGVGVVGLVRRADNVVIVAPNLGWHDVPLGDLLHRALGGSLPVLVANDADLSALAEMHRGAAIGASEVVSVWGEVGVGGGIVTRGELITGAAGLAGEVGHLPVNPEGSQCGCGSTGCWETEIGATALLRRAGLDPDAGAAAVDGLLLRAEAGDATALAALDAEARWIGIGVAGLISVLNPAIVVLGGLFGRIFAHTTVVIHQEIERRSLPAARAGVRIVPAALGADAPLLGAAELAFERVIADPKSVGR
jgi:predicted NBD/HSP70 family sugar kinase